MPFLRKLFCSSQTPARRTARRTTPITSAEVLESRRLLTNFLVTTADDTVAADGFVSLREAIQAANTNTAVNEAVAGEATGDTITFDALLTGATITLGGTELFIDEGLSIDGEDRGITIDGDDASRVFNVFTNEFVSLANLTVTKGNAVGSSGGGVAIGNGGSAELTGLTITQNSAVNHGGGLWIDGSAVEITNTAIQGNQSGLFGGGIAARGDGNIAITSSRIRNNTAGTDGGGIHTRAHQDDLTITDSNIDSNFAVSSARTGGGLKLGGNKVRIVGGTIVGNSAALRGGGIESNAADLLIQRTLIDGNSISGSGSSSTIGGGGILILSGIVNIGAGTTISNNQANGLESNGGGIYNDGGNLSISSSHLDNNLAQNNGGGIWNEDGASLTIVDTTFRENSAGNQGGGLRNGIGNVDIQRSLFVDNSAREGGGIANYSGPLITISNTTVTGNTSLDDGGGVHNSSGGSIDIDFSTITNNSSGTDNDFGEFDQGGGIRNRSGIVSINNTIVAGNFAGAGTSAVAEDVIGTLTSSSFNLIGDAASAGGLVDNTDGNIVGEDPLLDTLDNDGGHTLTHALLDGSPAIDTGDPAATITNDQRGADRPQEGGFDIGAYETSEFSDISGWWIFNGAAPQVLQLNEAVQLINEHGGISRGEFLSPTRIVALDWGNLIGDIVGDTIQWENATVWTDLPDLTSTQTINGDMPVLVEQLGIDLKFTNELGSTSSGRFLNATQVGVHDWQNLTGNLVGDEIQWDNGTTWTAQDDPADGESVNLSGAWAIQDQATTILQNGANILFINEHGDPSSGIIINSTRVIATDWGDLGGTIDPITRQIRWDNGSIWHRVPVLDRDENWSFNEMPTAVSQMGSEFLFTNEVGARSTGRFDPAQGLVADDWGLEGTVDFEEAAIEWSNLSRWDNSDFGAHDEVFADTNDHPWIV